MRDDAEIAEVILTDGAVVFWGLFCKSAPEQGAGHNKKVNQVAQYSVLPGFTCANSVQKCRRRRCLPPIPARVRPAVPERSEERRVGQACVSTGRSRWSPDH